MSNFGQSHLLTTTNFFIQSLTINLLHKSSIIDEHNKKLFSALPTSFLVQQASPNSPHILINPSAINSNLNQVCYTNILARILLIQCIDI